MSTYYDDNHSYRQNNYGNNNRGYNSRGRGGQGKKRTFAKEGRIRGGKSDGLLYISATRYSKKFGKVTAKAFENHSSKKSESDRGNKFVSLAFEITWVDTGNKSTYWALYNLTSGKAFIEELGWVISTKGNYFGPVKNNGRR